MSVFHLFYKPEGCLIIVGGAPRLSLYYTYSLVSVQDGWTALHMASQKGHYEVVEYLVERAHCDTSESMYT